MERQNSIETELALVKREVSQASKLFTKLDSAIDKLSDAASSISKMLAVHDEKLNMHDRIDREIFELIESRRKDMQEDVKELNSRINTVQRELADDIQQTENKILTVLGEVKNGIVSNKKLFVDEQKKLEDRIKSLENWRWMLVGGGLVVGFILSKATGLFTSMFGG